jgi:hypothetical protein
VSLESTVLELLADEGSSEKERVETSEGGDRKRAGLEAAPPFFSVRRRVKRKREREKI